jgi:hypothetical protein
MDACLREESQNPSVENGDSWAPNAPRVCKRFFSRCAPNDGLPDLNKAPTQLNRGSCLLGLGELAVHIHSLTGCQPAATGAWCWFTPCCPSTLHAVVQCGLHEANGASPEKTGKGNPLECRAPGAASGQCKRKQQSGHAPRSQHEVHLDCPPGFNLNLSRTSDVFDCSSGENYRV